MSLPVAVIADDIELNRAILNEVLNKEYQVLEAANGREALELVEKHRDRIAILLLDIVMPVVDGFQVLETMNRLGLSGRLPVVMISAESTEDFVLRCYELGAADFISRPFSPNIVLRRVNNIVELYQHKGQLEKLVATQTKKLRQVNDFMVNTLSNVVEFRNGESGMHIRRIRYVTEQLLKAISFRHKEYGLTAATIEEITNAAALHDIGKIAVPEHILNKPGPLTPEEYEIVKTHPMKGAEILESIDHLQDWPYYRYCYDICRYHHERWDGGGYPDGLKGDEIPLSAQAVSLADVYDALTSKRVYKSAYSHQKSVAMIKNGECGVFNPQLMECFMEIEKDLENSIEVLSRERQELLSDEVAQLAPREGSAELSGRILALLEQERVKYQSLASLTDEILFDYDVDSDTLTFSEKFKSVFGGDPIIRNVAGKNGVLDFFEKEDAKQLAELPKIITPKNPVVKLRLRARTRKDGLRWFELTIKSLWSSDTIPQYLGSLGKIADVDEEMRENHLLKEKAEKDSLTGIYNRGTLQRVIKEKLKESPRELNALLFVDLDGFKQINDTKGHVFGDAVLKFTAEKMRGNFRSTDVVGRLGGDEFVIFLSRLQFEEDGKRKAEELCALISEGYPIGESVLPLSASVGIAFSPKDGESYEDLLNNADQALYRAKAQNRGGFTVFSE